MNLPPPNFNQMNGPPGGMPPQNLAQPPGMINPGQQPPNNSQNQNQNPNQNFIPPNQLFKSNSVINHPHGAHLPPAMNQPPHQRTGSNPMMGSPMQPPPMINGGMSTSFAGPPSGYNPNPNPLPNPSLNLPPGPSINQVGQQMSNLNLNQPPPMQNSFQRPNGPPQMNGQPNFNPTNAGGLPPGPPQGNLAPPPGQYGLPPGASQGPPPPMSGGGGPPPGPNHPGMPAHNQMSYNNPSMRIKDLLKEQKSMVSPEGWFINEPDMEFTKHIPGRQPPEPRTNCIPEVMRGTLAACPESSTILKKARLPFGLLMQPYKDVSNLSVITTHKEIVRCSRCRMYINPFVTFVNQSQWRCCMCNRMNDVPQHFMQKLNSAVDSSGRTQPEYDYPETRPEINTSTIEYVAPSQYSTRAPPPVRYVYLLDVSSSAVASGYLTAFSSSLKENLSQIKDRHDKRLQLGFIFFDQNLHFFEITEKSGIKHLVVPDFGDEEKDMNLEDLLPRPENLLINAHEYSAEIDNFLDQLPSYFNSHNTTPGRALGPAVKACCRLLQSSGGRCSVFLGGIPTCGYGKLKHRNDSNHVDKKSGKITNLHSASDIYKNIALECNGNQQSSIQMGIDVFFISGQYSDISTISNLARWSSGSIFYYPALHHSHDPLTFEKFRRDLDRYFTRKIGFEAVLRVRMTNGLKIQEFHGNAFVRGEDILALANVNPDAGFSLSLEIEEELSKFRFATFQSALLYTNSRGERRVRVHTMTMPIARR